MVEEDEVAKDLYEIKTLLKKKEFNDKIEYLVKWLNCGNEYNV